MTKDSLIEQYTNNEVLPNITFGGISYKLREMPWREGDVLVFPLEDGTNLKIKGYIDFGGDTDKGESVVMVGNNRVWESHFKERSS